MARKKEDKNSGIYYIQNKITSQIYIGQSKRLNARKIDHFAKLRRGNHANSHLQNSFNKYGEENFEYGVIQYCDELNLDRLEIAYMNLFNVKKHGFNISDGGHNGGHKKEYAHIRLSSYNRHNQRMYALVYKNQIIRSNDISFLEHLMEKYFDESFYLKEGHSFDDLKKEAKKNMGKRMDKVRIVKHGFDKGRQVFAIKYDGKIIRNSTDINFLEFLINKYFDEENLLKKEFSIFDVKREKKSGEYLNVKSEIKREKEWASP